MREDKQAISVGSAIVAGSAIVLRHYDGISAIDGATGHLLWNYTAGTTFLRTWAEIAQAGAGDGGRGTTPP